MAISASSDHAKMELCTKLPTVLCIGLMKLLPQPGAFNLLLQVLLLGGKKWKSRRMRVRMRKMMKTQIAVLMRMSAHNSSEDKGTTETRRVLVKVKAKATPKLRLKIMAMEIAMASKTKMATLLPTQSASQVKTTSKSLVTMRSSNSTPHHKSRLTLPPYPRRHLLSNHLPLPLPLTRPSPLPKYQLSAPLSLNPLPAPYLPSKSLPPNPPTQSHSSLTNPSYGTPSAPSNALATPPEI
jgi:hypothetical protein